MSLFEIKRKALKSLVGKWGLVVQLTILIFLINTIFPFLVEVFLSGGFMNWLDQEQAPLSASIIRILLSIAFIPLSIAVTWFFLGITRFEKPQITEVFTVYKDAKTSFRLIGASFLIGIFFFLWSLLFIIPGIIKSIAYSQTFFLLKDHPEYSVLEAITESRRRMKGYKWKYFLLILSFIGWGILCLFTLGIGLLWLSPYISTTNATFYNELINTQGSTSVDDTPTIEE